MISFCQQNFDVCNLGIWEESWPETGLPYSHLPAGLVLNDVGELAGCALPVSSACWEEEQLGIKVRSSSERLFYVIKICLGCSKKQELKDSGFFSVGHEGKSIFWAVWPVRLWDQRRIGFFYPFAAWNNDTNKMNVWRDASECCYSYLIPFFSSTQI